MQSKVKALEKQMKKLEKLLNAKEETLNKRQEILKLMATDLKIEGTPSKERINRVEGYVTYIISYKLEDLIEERNWFVGVLLSASILEDVGKRKLKREFKGKIDADKIDRLTLEETIMMLFASQLIDSKMYSKLMKIKTVRNDLAHDSFQAMSAFLRTGATKDKACREFESVIKMAIFCLKTLNPPATP